MARAREAELSGLLKGKKEELKALTAQQGEYINDLTRGVVMYKHLGLDFERAWPALVWTRCIYIGRPSDSLTICLSCICSYIG